MPIFRRGQKDRLELGAEDVIWGVPRREGASDRDDPLVHAGLVQHAFEIGIDDRAICGFRPPVRVGFDGASRDPELALPNDANPRCPKCVTALAEATSAEATAEDAPERAEDAVQADPEPIELSPIDDLGATDVADAGAGIEEDEPVADDQASSSARDSAWAPRRSSARRGGRTTVPAGRRSAVVQLPDKLRGYAIAANVDGQKGSLRVESVAVGEDGQLRITLNERAATPVDVVWFVVSGPDRS